MSGQQYIAASDVDLGIPEASTELIDLIRASGFFGKCRSQIFEHGGSCRLRTAGCTVSRSTVCVLGVKRVTGGTRCGSGGGGIGWL
jgi:hypothetical protein